MKLNIAGIVLAVISKGYDWDFEEDDACQHFVAAPNDVAEAFVHVCREHPPECKWREKVFNAGSAWTLYRCAVGCVLDVPLTSEPIPHRIAVFTQDFETGTVYVLPFEFSDGHHPYPLTYPLDALWVMNLLSRGRGVMVHACGVDDNGRGMIFAGPSGVGKSTLAKLWKTRKEDVTILSDDCVILRKVEGRFVVYGTPWGDIVGTPSEGVPLAKVFFLRQARQNNVKPKQGREAVVALLARSFSALYDPVGMQYTLDFCADLLEQVPCYELSFVPDESAIDAIRNAP